MHPPAPASAPAAPRLLVATDFSPLGNAAVMQAYALAQPGALLRVIHLVHRLALPHGEFARSLYQPLFDVQHAQVRAQAAETLLTLVPPDAAARGVTVETAVVESDDAAEGICAEAARCGATLICLGSHGLTGLVASLLGSVAQGVLRRSPVPVLLVPQVK